MDSRRFTVKISIGEFDVKITKFFEKYNYSVCVPKQVYFDQNKELGTLNETYNLNVTSDCMVIPKLYLELDNYTDFCSMFENSGINFEYN